MMRGYKVVSRGMERQGKLPLCRRLGARGGYCKELPQPPPPFTKYSPEYTMVRYTTLGAFIARGVGGVIGVHYTCMAIKQQMSISRSRVQSAVDLH